MRYVCHVKTIGIRTSNVYNVNINMDLQVVEWMIFGIFRYSALNV
jgi:hypothetical protein